MANEPISRPESWAGRTEKLPKVSASQLVAGMQKVTNAVMTGGAVVITRHDQPAMVLLSIDRYLQLEQAAEPNLDVLTRQFDDMLAQMQRPQAAQRMSRAFAMTGSQLGAAALGGAALGATALRATASTAAGRKRKRATK